MPPAPPFITTTLSCRKNSVWGARHRNTDPWPVAKGSSEAGRPAVTRHVRAGMLDAVTQCPHKGRGAGAVRVASPGGAKCRGVWAWSRRACPAEVPDRFPAPAAIRRPAPAGRRHPTRHGSTRLV